jgi:hypothetical protein
MGKGRIVINIQAGIIENDPLGGKSTILNQEIGRG